MVAFVGKYCMSKLFSTEEAFVRKRGHGSIAQSLEQKVGEMNGWVASPVSGNEQGQIKVSTGIS